MKKTALLFLVMFVLVSGCDSDKEMKIISAEPADPSTQRPAMVKIKGQGFADGARVWFGAQECPQVIVASEDSIVALPPAIMSSGTVDIRVENPDGKSAGLPSALHFDSTLAVSGIRPKYMLKGEKEITIRIRGEGFAKGAKVFFQEVESPKVEFKTSNIIEALVPDLKPGILDLCVENPDGTRVTLFEAFQVLNPDEKNILKMTNQAEELGVAGEATVNDIGVAFADVNRDGFLDLLVTGSKSYRFYLGSKDGKFNDITETTNFNSKSIIYGGFFGDFDNDGLPDLLITGQPTYLYHNLGDAKFEDVTVRVGLTKRLLGWAAAWGDYDADGLLDLFVGTPRGDDHFFRNTGGRFEEVFVDIFEKTSGAREFNNTQPTTFSAAFGDYDNDGYPDLFVGVRGQPSTLFHNQKGKSFEDATGIMGLDFQSHEIKEKKIFKPNWGVTWADFDNDGFLDLFCASGSGGADLYRNRAGKGFSNVTKTMRMSFTRDTLSPAWGDLDNDGLLDLAVSDNLSGFRVYRNQGDGSFHEVTEELGMETIESYSMGIAWADVNRDGALDLYVTEFTLSNHLYINTPYPGRHYLEVELEGTTSNAMAIGAVVTIELGSTIMTRMVSGGEGYSNYPPPLLHFGLGSKDVVDKVAVRWPGGEIQTLEQVPADQLLVIKQPGERKTVSLPTVIPNPMLAPQIKTVPGDSGGQEKTDSTKP